MLAASGPAAAAVHAGTWTVGYRTPAALRGMHVVRTIPALRVAVVRGPVRRGPGIRFVQRLVERRSTAEPALATVARGIPYEWQWTAVHEEAVPDWVLRAASAVTIAVVDTGADLSTPDLAAKAPAAYNVRTGTPNVRDTNGHGTFVATLAAGSVTNADGIAGFGGDAKLLVIKAGGHGGSFSDIDEASAIVYAVDHGAQIVNLSLGGPRTSQTEQNAIAYAAAHGVLLVAAAGNELGSGDAAEYPAALIQPLGSKGRGGVGLAVGASTQGGGHASFSNAGSYLSLAAPGQNVFSAVSALAPAAAYPRTPLPGSLSGAYGFASGTSFAAPEVAGAAALVWAANPLLNAQQVADVLKKTAQGKGGWNPELGFGVIDVAAAVAAASGRPTVDLSAVRDSLGVRLHWQVYGSAARFQVAVSRDGGPAQVVVGSTTQTVAAFALTPGHDYDFTVNALDASGAVTGSSLPYRVTLSTR